MRSSSALSWIGLLAATIILGAGCTIKTSAWGKRCKTTPCTYFAQGKAFDGACGTKKGDDKNCYCIDKANNKLAQKQSGCSLSTQK